MELQLEVIHDGSGSVITANSRRLRTLGCTCSEATAMYLLKYMSKARD